MYATVAVRPAGPVRGPPILGALVYGYSLDDCLRPETFYEHFHEWFPSQACDVHRAEFCVWQTTASTQSSCTCEPHIACPPAYLPGCLLTRDVATSGAADAGEYEMHDLRLQWPFHMLSTGCSRSGKSTLTTRLVALSSRDMTRTLACVLVFYSHMQPAYRELARQALCPVELLDRAKHFTEQLTTEPGTLAIVDDMQVTHARLVSSWFTHWAHHYDLSIIHLVQNIFDKDPGPRTISLNATYIVLFKNTKTCPRSPTWTSRYTWAVMAC